MTTTNTYNLQTHTPQACKKHIKPTGMSTNATSDPTCQKCAHYIFNCTGRKTQ